MKNLDIKGGQTLFTTLALVLNIGHGTFLPPINRGGNCVLLLVHEASTSTWRSSEHPVMVNLGPCVSAPKLMVSHVSKLVQLQLVRLIHLVGIMNMDHIFLEYIEAHVLLIKARGDRVVAPPPLIQIPQTFLGPQILLMKIKTLGDPKNQSK